MELTAGVKTIANVKIQSGKFQRDSLSPLLFIKTMITDFEIAQRATNLLNYKRRLTTLCSSDTQQKMKKNWRL